MKTQDMLEKQVSRQKLQHMKRPSHHFAWVYALVLLLGLYSHSLLPGVVALKESFDENYISTATDIFQVRLSEACPDPDPGRVGSSKLNTDSSAPKGYAILIGVDQVGDILKISGAENDVSVLSAELSLLGYEVTKLFNPDRQTVFDGMATIIAKARCHDYVFLSYSGMNVVLPGVFLAGESIGPLSENLKSTGDSPMIIHNKNMVWALPSLTREIVERLRNDTRRDIKNVSTLAEFKSLTQDLRSNEHILPPDLVAGFVLALAKKGVHTVVLSDAGNDELLYLSSAFGRPHFSSVSRFTRFTNQETGDIPQSQVIESAYSGEQLYVYASRAGNETSERTFSVDGTEIVLGTISNAFIAALRKASTGTANELYFQMSGFLNEPGNVTGPQSFIIESSRPAFSMFLRKPIPRTDLIGELTVRLEGFGKVNSRGIRIVEQPEIMVDGFIEDERQAIAVIIEDKRYPTVNNRFSAVVRVAPSTAELSILAIFKNGDVAKKTVQVIYAGELESAVLKNPPYALLVANWKYQASGTSSRWSDLSSPPKDIAFLEEILAEKFGFRTTVKTPEGIEESLILHNASSKEIENKLYALEQSLNEYDRLLIYYAGHGFYHQKNPYWIPIDGEDTNPYTWLESDRLINGLRNMKALSVLVVSDSCFSGAMIGKKRDGDRLASLVRQNLQNKAQHKASLLEYAKHRSRQVITSGALSPVADLGHNSEGMSPFAYQFARSLVTLHTSHLSFSEDDLYYYLRRNVIGNKEPLKQTPLEGDLDDAGHDPEGSFVFVGIQK